MAGAEDAVERELDIPDVLPLLPVRDVVVFPAMVVPLFVSREISLNAVEQALKAAQRVVFAVAQRDGNDDAPRAPDGVYRLGTICQIIRQRKLPDGRVKVLVQGLLKATLEEIVADEPCTRARVTKIHELPFADGGDRALEAEALARSVKGHLEKLIATGKGISPEQLLLLSSVQDPGRLADLVAANLSMKVQDAQELLELMDPLQRLKAIHERLAKEAQLLAMQARIQSQAKEEISKTQREYYLREQLRQIQHELGERDEKAELAAELKRRIDSAQLPRAAQDEADKALRRLSAMTLESAEAAVVRAHLESICELPWTRRSPDSLDIYRARHGPAAGPRLARRSPRRGRDPRAPAQLRGRAPGEDPARDEARRDPQPRVRAGRDRQARRRLPRRPVLGAPGGAGSRAEPRLPRPLPGPGVRPQQRPLHRHRERAGPHPAGAARSHGADRDPGLFGGGEAAHRRAPPAPAPARGARAARGPARAPPPDAARRRPRLHARGRPARADARAGLGVPEDRVASGRRRAAENPHPRARAARAARGAALRSLRRAGTGDHRLRDGPRLDAVRRGDPPCGGGRNGRPRAAGRRSDPHRAAGERDAGVRPGGALLPPQPRTRPRRTRGLVRNARDPPARPRRGDPQGRAERRSDHGVRPRVAPVQATM